MLPPAAFALVLAACLLVAFFLVILRDVTAGILVVALLLVGLLVWGRR